MIKARKSMAAALPGLFCLFLAAFFIFAPKEAAESILRGVNLWVFSVMPAQFFYGVISYVILNTDSAYFLIKLFSPLARWLKLPSAGAGYLSVSLLCGAPVSVKNICEASFSGRLTPKQAQRLLPFCSFISPAFLYTYVGCSLFASPYLGIFFALLGVLSAFITGLIMDREGKSSTPSPSEAFYDEGKKAVTGGSFPSVFSGAVITSKEAVLSIGAYIALFSLIEGAAFSLGLLSENIYLSCAISLLMEMTSFFKRASTLTPIPAFLFTCLGVGFSGSCLLMQQADYIIKSGLDIKSFLLSKLLQTALCALLGFCGCFIINS